MLLKAKECAPIPVMKELKISQPSLLKVCSYALLDNDKPKCKTN